MDKLKDLLELLAEQGLALTSFTCQEFSFTAAEATDTEYANDEEFQVLVDAIQFSDSEPSEPN